MSSREFTEWAAYAQLEPFGEQRADLRMGILAALQANMNRDPKKTKQFTPEDFMPSFESEQRQRNGYNAEALEMMAAVYGGTITREEPST